MSDAQAELFDPDRTVAVWCPVNGCGAIRLPGQDRVVTCQHELDPEQRRRPKGCLNAVDPSTSDWGGF